MYACVLPTVCCGPCVCSMAQDGWWGVATGRKFYRCKEDHPRCLEGEKKEAENGEEGEASKEGATGETGLTAEGAAKGKEGEASKEGATGETGLTAEGAAKGKEGKARRRAEETAVVAVGAVAASGKEPNTEAKVDVFAGEVTMNVCGKVGRHRRVVAHAFRPPAAVVFG